MMMMMMMMMMMIVFVKFLGEVGEIREVTNIPSAELDKLLCNFYINVRRKDKTEYEPGARFSKVL